MDTVNKDQELELASVTLVDGLHFARDIGGIRIDLNAEESVGGVGAGPQPHRLLPVFDGWMHSHGCPLDLCYLLADLSSPQYLGSAH